MTVGWYNVEPCNRGIMSGKTPDLDKLAEDGMLFTDFYAQARCTASRANFITGEIPPRARLTTVGQASADVRVPAQACTSPVHSKRRITATGSSARTPPQSRALPCDGHG
jgi:arylsulfatase A-like enzyme